jgi:hypothetical protein
LDKAIHHKSKIDLIPTGIPNEFTNFLELCEQFQTDTLILNNNLGVVYLFDSISNNQVVNRKFVANIKPKVVREPTPEPPKVRNQVYFGLGGSYSNQDWVNSLGTNMLLRTKDDKIFQIGVGVANRTSDGITGEFIPYVNGGVFWKIKFNRE